MKKSPERLECIKRMKEAVDSGRGVAVADVAYCNGGDVKLTEAITREIGLFRLWGYAGWNTASNTIGTVICQAVLRYLYGDTATHRYFTALRILDDAVYSQAVRREMLKLGSYDCCAIVNKINEYTRVNFPGIAAKYTAVECYLPWSRLFEIGLKVEEKKYEA